MVTQSQLEIALTIAKTTEDLVLAKTAQRVILAFCENQEASMQDLQNLDADKVLA
jgi:hypothetical protein